MRALLASPAAAPGRPHPGGHAGDLDQLSVPWVPADAAALVSGGPQFLAGYRFLECVGRSPAAETWKVLDPAGNRRLIKLVLGFNAVAQGEEGLARLRSLRHPALAPLHVVAADHRVALVTYPGDLSLAARLKACQAGRFVLPAAQTSSFGRDRDRGKSIRLGPL